MDETVIEVLSRHLDGDLNPEEERDLVARLEAEPVLAAQLEAMHRVRRSIAALANDECPPAELDAVIEPLLRGRPDPLFARPWTRWLATAAVIAVGFTVVIEVNRRNLGPSFPSIARMSEKDSIESTERFSLAPLPTSSLSPEQQPLGASDRLLASPVPEVELEEPRPLDVLGPLEETVGLEINDEDPGPEPAKIYDEGAAAQADAFKEKNELRQPASTELKRDRETSGSEEKNGAVRGGGRSEGMQSLEASPPRGLARLFVFIDGESAWQEFTPSAPCKPGRYSVRVVITRGVVREARPIGGAASASPTQRLCAANLVIHLELEDVADGEYPAEVVVETRGSDG